MKWNTLRRLLTRRRPGPPADPNMNTLVLDTGTSPPAKGEAGTTAAERYRLEKKLGGGGMGEVWLATDTLLDRPVALKYLKATQDPRHKELFLSEARILAQANHPNITLIYDAVFDEQRQGFYLVMEYVKGKTLSDKIDERDEPLPMEVIMDVTMGVLRALHYAHNKGIVHRDIKPANVIIQEDGVIKLTDFGVAGLVTLLAEGEQQIVGTPSYMSPEQIDGNALDGRADLYSFGVMLFEMVSGGNLPFQVEDTLALFDAHLYQAPPPLSQFSTGVPLALEHAIMRLLAKNPAERYPSAEVALAVMEAIHARQRLSQPHLNLLDLAANPLVGRVAELEKMEVIWADVQNSARPHLLIIKGEKGIGKSRLATEFLGHRVVDQGTLALAASCEEAGRAYAPFATILATVIDKRLARKATGEQINELLAYLPDLPRLLDVTPPPVEEETASPPPAGPGLWQTLSQKMAGPTPSPQVQQKLFSAILAVLSQLGPTAILLERANFLDPASLALMAFLVHQNPLPVLLCATWQDTGAAIPWLDSFSANEKTLLTLPPLSAAAVKEYLPHLTGGPVSDMVAESVMEHSHGNPLRVGEVTRRLIETKEIQPDESGQWRYTVKELAAPEDSFLPKAVLTAFTRRISQWSDRDRDALILAALSEPAAEFDFELWVTLLGGEAQRELAQQVLAEALNQRLVRQVSPQRYAFRAADMDKILTTTLPATRRRDLHRQMAQTLRLHGADPALVAYHEEQAG